MAKKIKDIRNTLERIAADRRFHLRENTSEEVAKVVRKPRETHSFVLRESVIGRDGDKNEIIRLLLESCADHEHKVDHQEKVSVIPIVGMGGVGKTTLTQLVFNDESVRKHFDLKIWVCVSENFDEELLMEKIVKIAGDVSTKDPELEQLQRNLRKKLAGKRYLLVLDDMWNENPRKWQNLKGLLTDCGEGSRIIVTTRSKKVANLMSTSIQPYELGILNPDNSWSLFKKLAFEQGCQEQISCIILDIAKEIVKKCGGVPLAISMIGSMLYQRNPETDWPSFLQNELSNISLEENDILKTLKLSYDYFPSHLKRCFTYCQLFPKDYEIDVQTMVTLWIAQGFIKSSDHSQSLKDIGYGYFLELFWRSFFQEDKRDELNKVITCKMHDLVHDLAIQVAGGEYATLKLGEGNIHKKIRSVSFEFELQSLEEVPISLLQAKMLRSILFPKQILYPAKVRQGESICDLIVSNFKFLRTLDLQNLGINILPNSIGKLKHLRYLDLSKNEEMKTLPTSITKLVNLQTLKLNACYKLQELPKDIHKLVNLRHLELYNSYAVRHMPRGLSQLTNLQTLSQFVLSDDNEGSKLDELAGLSDLGGELEILGLRHGIETKTAKLKEKQNLGSLHLRWDLVSRYNNDNASSSNEKCEMTIEGLHPHQNLRELTLGGYRGVKLSSWLPFLTNLVNLQLFVLPRCKQLPPLNQFPHLKKMQLFSLPCLEYIINDDVDGSEFWTSSSSSSSRTVLSIHISSSLNQLQLQHLPELKGWWRVDDIADDDENQVVLPSFPCLSELTVEDCPKLTCMPLYPNVERLTLENTRWKPFEQTTLMLANTTTFIAQDHIEASSSSLSASSSTAFASSSPLSRLAALKLGRSSDVDPPESLPKWMKCLTYSLKELEIRENHELRYLSPSIQYLTSLQKLRIVTCGELIETSDWICNLSSLRQLHLWHCPSLKSLPVSVSGLTCLRFLWIYNCPALLERCQRPDGEDWPKIQHIPIVQLH